MASPLLDIAMSYVKAVSPSFEDENAKEEIRQAFSEYLSNNTDGEHVARLLRQYISSTNPLERIEAILNTSDTPLKNEINDMNVDSLSNMRKKTRPWSQTEDTRLLAGVHRYGLDNWILVAKFVGNCRTRAQCAQRWFRGLDPRISRQHWSQEEEKRLFALIEIYGDKSWIKVASELGNRSDVQCRYHYLQLQKEAKKEFQRNEISQSSFIDRKEIELSHLKIPSINQNLTSKRSPHSPIKEDSPKISPLQTPASSPFSSNDVTLSVVQPNPQLISPYQKLQASSQPTFTNQNISNNLNQNGITQISSSPLPTGNSLSPNEDDIYNDLEDLLPLNIQTLFGNHDNSMLYDSLWPVCDFF